METFQQHCEGMELETFDPAAFKGDDTVPQDLCAFVLALACIYNDSKNITYVALLLKNSKPAGNWEKTAAWGGLSTTGTGSRRAAIYLTHIAAGTTTGGRSVFYFKQVVGAPCFDNTSPVFSGLT